MSKRFEVVKRSEPHSGCDYCLVDNETGWIVMSGKPACEHFLDILNKAAVVQPMSLAAYCLATERRKTAYERYNYASTALELAQVKERLAELKSQHEPLAGLIEKPMGERDRLYAAAFYAVVGRMPSPEEVKL